MRQTPVKTLLCSTMLWENCTCCQCCHASAIVNAVIALSTLQHAKQSVHLQRASRQVEQASAGAAAGLCDHQPQGLCPGCPCCHFAGSDQLACCLRWTPDVHWWSRTAVAQLVVWAIVAPAGWQTSVNMRGVTAVQPAGQSYVSAKVSN